MSAVDVLAVMDEAAHCLNSSDYREDRDALLEARDAVAELIAAADSCAEAFYDFLDDEVPDVVAAEYPALARLTAALARVQGDAA